MLGGCYCRVGQWQGAMWWGGNSVTVARWSWGRIIPMQASSRWNYTQGPCKENLLGWRIYVLVCSNMNKWRRRVMMSNADIGKIWHLSEQMIGQYVRVSVIFINVIFFISAYDQVYISLVLWCLGSASTPSDSLVYLLHCWQSHAWHAASRMMSPCLMMSAAVLSIRHSFNIPGGLMPCILA